MKNALLLSTFLCLLSTWLICACENKNEAEKTKTTKNIQHLLIFIDKTISTENNFQTALPALRKIIDQNLQCNGNKVMIRFIHQNTGGDAPTFEKTFRLSPQGDTNTVPPQDRRKIIGEYEDKILDAKQLVISTIEKSIQYKNQYNTKLQTDIWQTLEIISRFAQNTHPNDRIVVVYLSDMIESINKNARRDLHNNPPKNKAEAEEMAKNDLLWIYQNLKIDPKKLSQTEIYIAFPQQPNQASQNNLLRYYWETLLKDSKSINYL